MPKSLRRLTLTSLTLCLFALPTAGLRAQDKPGQQPPPPDSGGAVPGPPMLYPNPDGASRAKGAAKKALITFKPEPGFTEEARKNNVTGVVRLRAILHASGGVQNISVVKGLPDGLTEKAISAARQIRFTPAEKDGRSVSQYVVLEYNFNIY